MIFLWKLKKDGDTFSGNDLIFFNSEENVDLNSFHLDSPCLTSTQKGDRPQRCEKFSGEDLPLEINNLSVTKPTNRCCNATIDQVSILLQNVLH